MAATCRVQLAVYDGSCPSQLLSSYENKIGGYPDFFPNCTLSSPPTCKCCGSSLALLTQVYCPHDSSPYHRLLHVYCCCQRACWSKSECWVVLRSQLKDPSYEISRKKEVTKLSPVAEPKDKLTTAREWCEDVDDWGDGLANGAGEDGWGDGSSEEGRNSPPNFCSPRDVSEADNECNKVEHLMKAMTVADTSNGTAPIEHVILPSYLGPCYPAGYVCVVEEPDSADTVEVQKLLKKYKNNYPNCDFTVAPEGEGGKESKHRKSGQREKSSRHGDHINGGEAYEKGVARHGDKTFQKFHKQLSKFPQQILRYSWKGKPLLFSSNPAHAPPKDSELNCKECGAPCVFELQLMPSLVYVLQQNQKGEQAAGASNDKDLLQSVAEFGTIFIYSCSVSCWDESNPQFREEIVILQPDLDAVHVDKF